MKGIVVSCAIYLICICVSSAKSDLDTQDSSQFRVGHDYEESHFDHLDMKSTNATTSSSPPITSTMNITTKPTTATSTTLSTTTISTTPSTTTTSTMPSTTTTSTTPSTTTISTTPSTTTTSTMPSTTTTSTTPSTTTTSTMPSTTTISTTPSTTTISTTPSTTTTKDITTTTTKPIKTTTPTTSTINPVTTTLSPSGENRCSSYNTTVESCKFNYNVTINSRSPCIFNCTYDPSKLSPLRLEVHLAYKHPARHPTFVTAQQLSLMNSWTLPVLFPNHGEYQKYTSVESLLCPPVEEKIETIEVRITTASESDISMNVRMNNQSFELKMQDTVTVKTTPVSPDYRFYKWTGDQTSVLISAESKNSSENVCAILSLQNAKCPLITDETGIRAGGGRFQTFTSRAGMVATRSQYPDGIHMIVWPLPDDDACTLFPESRSNHTTRHKSVEFQVFNHSTIGSTWYIFLITGCIVFGSTLGIGLIALKLTERKLNSSFNYASTIDDDERELLDEDQSSRQGRRGYAEEGVAFVGRVDNGFTSSIGSAHSQGTTPMTSGGGGNTSVGGTFRLLDNSDGSHVSILPAPGSNANQPYAPPTTYAPHPAALNFTSSFNPVYVMWWKRYAMFETQTAEANLSEMGFQHNVLIMAMFAALPTTELIRSYLKMLSYHGDEDQCFFNSRCLTGVWIFHDFARVFTNIGYIFAGIFFTRVVLKHKEMTYRILSHYTATNNSVGISRHYGLFLSIGYGLIIQGLMSSLYHTCPNSVTIRFDMMFMYVMSVAAIVSVWGLRHGDITHHVYPTMGLIGTTLLLAEGRQWASRLTFWLFMSVFYFILLTTTTVMMSKCGIWSFSPWRMLQVLKGWKPVRDNLASVLTDEDRKSAPLHILRIVIGVVSNLSLMLYGCIADPNVYNYILVICLTNLGLYFSNYILTKTLVYKERGTIIAFVCLSFSIVFWIMAIVSFSYHNTNSEASASDSRAMNSTCAFFEVFDTHDAWHLLSSLALYTFFLGLLTLDDDLARTPSSQIHVF